MKNVLGFPWRLSFTAILKLADLEMLKRKGHPNPGARGCDGLPKFFPRMTLARKAHIDVFSLWRPPLAERL